MPCYCDIPNDEDQVEIEKRAKTRMYFDALWLLTPEQIEDSIKINIPQVPVPDPNTALCKLCSILTKEQMKMIDAYYFQIKWAHKTLYDWYIKHCEDDLRK